MSTDLVVTKSRGAVELSNDQLQYIANTEFVPQGLRGNVPAIMACIATGRALGIDDMSALRLIHLVNGRPTFSAELMVQIVRRAGHSIVGESKAGSCTVTGTRKDNGDTMTVTWTLEMAARAGLANKQTWKAYPEALLWARAASQLCRQLFPDCFAGQTYTPEEIGAEFTDSVGEPTAVEPATVPVPQADLDGVEPASPADVDLTDPDIPFGDDPPVVPPISGPQKKKLNVMVKSTLADKVPLGRVYATVADLRGWTKDELILHVGGQDPDGTLHFSPLRDALSKHEATVLIDKLEHIEAGQ